MNLNLNRKGIMDIRKRHWKIVGSITRPTILEIEHANNPTLATDIVSKFTPEKACAVLDKMSPLGAAFVLCILRTRAKDGDEYAKSVIALAEQLQITGIKGLCAARDEMYRLTGVFIA